MSMRLKDIYSKDFFKKLGAHLSAVLPDFDQSAFIKAVFVHDWEHKELKERMKHTRAVLHQFLPADFKSAVSVLRRLADNLAAGSGNESGLAYMFIPDYIETYGIHDFTTSTTAFEHITPFTSCEFAVRPFLIRYPDKMIVKMLRWSKHRNHHVRRLASEGSRPRLPWAMAVPGLKEQPFPLLPILENLKNDPSEYVRRSVANSLNDISKDRPEILLRIVKDWSGCSKETDALLRHASRTLLKSGNKELLQHFGFISGSKPGLSSFFIHTPVLKIPDALAFSFKLRNTDNQACLFRIEYAIHYLRQKGHYSKKVFKISERVLQPEETILIKRQQSFRIITTRKFYPGLHKLTIIINGQERKSGNFELLQ